MDQNVRFELVERTNKLKTQTPEDVASSFKSKQTVTGLGTRLVQIQTGKDILSFSNDTIFALEQ